MTTYNEAALEALRNDDREKLAVLAYRLAAKIARRRLPQRSEDRDWLHDVATDATMIALSRWNPERGPFAQMVHLGVRSATWREYQIANARPKFTGELDPHTPAPTPAEQQGSDAADILRQALALLPEHHRTIVLMKAGGASTTDAAAATGQSVDNAQTLWRRVRDRLAKNEQLRDAMQ